MDAKVCVGTSRPIGEKCIRWAKSVGIKLHPMDSCDVFVSLMYDKLLHEEYLSKHKAYNFHPGILPEYRGSGAYSWVILNGERETGVTLHEIDKDIDHGGIIDVRKFDIKSTDTAGSLFKQAEKVMFNMFRFWLPRLIRGDYVSVPQTEAYSGVYYRKELEREKDITRRVRAFSFAGKEPCFFVNSRGEKVYINYE